MSSPSNDGKQVSRAEVAFRNAFDRLKQNTPNLLPKGSPVSQNNVAREAGLDPSALKKARFPILVAEIQSWVSSHGGQTEPKQQHSANRSEKRDLRQQLASMKAQRDNALGLLAESDALILQLTHEIERLKAVKATAQIKPIWPGVSM
ncbi:hypothetical protein H8F21_13425 [Pseudomonas sp. P66]|uniref:Uncharacterized protein n=1 Tax=Pseudomonas arcuscaelestis TaxID=2710591 RepID=A0ABS2BY72_9PSED|nr:hypothetical protein [Pseudomonas arcuscaelestis]MBM5458564.1 hypothetical protein [Pseudomonas arcuscaelestis]